MKNIKKALPFALLLALPFSAAADNCSWTHSSVSSGGSTANVTYSCNIAGTVAAIKTVGTKAVGSPTCSISLTNGFFNSGTCVSPNITMTNPCTNSGAHYGTFWASQWSNHASAIDAFCGACGYNVTPIFSGPGEPQLTVTCK